MKTFALRGEESVIGIGEGEDILEAVTAASIIIEMTGLQARFSKFCLKQNGTPDDDSRTAILYAGESTIEAALIVGNNPEFVIEKLAEIGDAFLLLCTPDFAVFNAPMPAEYEPLARRKLALLGIVSSGV